MWNFKGYLWNSTQNILLIHWKIRFLYNIGILRALRFKSSYAFLKRPPGDTVWQPILNLYNHGHAQLILGNKKYNSIFNDIATLRRHSELKYFLFSEDMALIFCIFNAMFVEELELQGTRGSDLNHNHLIFWCYSLYLYLTLNKIDLFLPKPRIKMCPQVFSNHDIDYEGQTHPCLPWGWISTICAISV